MFDEILASVCKTTGADPGTFVKGGGVQTFRKNLQSQKIKRMTKGEREEASVFSFAFVWSKSNLTIDTAFQKTTFISITPLCFLHAKTRLTLLF